MLLNVFRLCKIYIMEKYEYRKDSPRRHLEYPEKTMFEMIRNVAEQYPDAPAYEFYGKKTNYRELIGKIETTARAFRFLGLGNDSIVTICLPNIPVAIDSFYALNRIGAVANMIHPLSAKDEITYYMDYSRSTHLVTLDMFYEKVKEAVKNADHPVKIIIARMQDVLPVHLGFFYALKEGRKYRKYPEKDDLLWKDFLKMGQDLPLPECKFEKNYTSVILYSGGTSGKPKGCCLSDLNFNALAIQAKEFIQVYLGPGMLMLSCMPMFHGFGLGINIHTVLIHGACCILMPSFNIKTYSEMLVKKKPNFIAGVPTIFEALLHAPALEGQDLSFLKGMFCGGDSLPLEVKHKVDAFLKEHHAEIQVREGYGLTECVTASCLTPRDEYRPNSIGLPFADTYYDVVKPGTDISLKPGEEGEIVLKGPTVMVGYLDRPEETAETLRKRSDGDTWLYTGDLGYMDEDGYIYFVQRMKRMIITNGYNVYPGILENAIDSCEGVDYSCVIGVKDTRRGQRVKAFVVVKDGYPRDDAMKKKIMDHISTKVAAYALPKEIEYRDELPKTLVGKIAYRILEEEENKKAETQAQETPKKK